MAALTRGLGAEKYDRIYSDRDLVSRILRYFRPYKLKIIVVTIAIFIIAGMGALLPIIIANSLGTGAEGSNYPLGLVILVFVIGVATWGLSAVRRYLTAQVIADVMMTMRDNAFDAAMRQDLSFFDEFSTGRIVSRITSDTQEFGEVVTIATDVINQLAVAFILIFVLVAIDWRLTLAVLAMTPLVAVVALAFRRLARDVTRQSSRALAEVNKAIQEAVSGIRVAKNYRQEGAIYEEFVAVNEQSYAINVRRAFVLANIFPTLNALAGLGTATLVYFGGRSAVAGAISIASWYLFVTTVDRFWFPVTNLSAFWSQFQAGLAATERVFGLIDAESSVVQTGDKKIDTLRGEIVFDHVYFRYSSQEQVLNDFSLHIQPGESVALVGHTGAGKSSIIKLVARFYEFQQGTITIDGIDIRDFDLKSFRSRLGIVSQVPFLFSGTVADNIRYACPDATDEHIESVACRIGQGEWLETLPDGIYSEVGERGSRLSMGQRQLVALTRVLVQAPSIFILDEATASVDPFTESQIQHALDLIMAHSTAIIIAHRLSTVRSADRIIVLQKGHIIEEGSHNDLMAQSGHYAELYDTYFRHQSPQAIHAPEWLKE
ncbi:MAG: ABC transporter ATP-binding protein [Anaerolineales bacterium]|uniref:ABC transporter ATP-binding protein n=1 Tax=Promineifilum sp. TaxID=2664178 RepID=UPI001DF69776|nr:ABC transporter ATP-binding protein [Anaerolineales bacterium]MCO5179462.1 ABC transporter ATP-binding protein/permease [Promineifilum sp.]